MEGEDERYKLPYDKLVKILSETNEHDRVDEFWVKHVLYQMELNGIDAVDLLNQAYENAYIARIFTILSVFTDEIDEDLVIEKDDGLMAIHNRRIITYILTNRKYLEALLRHSVKEITGNL